ncbi:MAG: Dihydrodipicolinate synthetase family protein [Roseomonas sp.]|nr:Dihydrodipicolinate synthetase family protein [Roseomonas sp.]
MSISSQSGHFGLGCAIATPVSASGAIDLPRLATHAKACLDGGCDNLTLFGTTGEGSSFGIAPRQAAFAALVAAGIAPAEKLLSGVIALSDEDAAAQAEAALAAGCGGLLIAPPSYFRAVDDDSVFAWFSRILSPLAGRTKVYLYHIPSMTGVAVSPAVVGRLRTAFPGLVAGVKDSSGSWENTAALLAQHRDLQILVGDERHLAHAVREGGSGTICGVSNIAPQILLGPAKRGEEDPRIAPLIEAAFQHPIIPALKALIACRYGDMAWLNTRAPLPPLTEAVARQLNTAVAQVLRQPVAA